MFVIFQNIKISTLFVNSTHNANTTRAFSSISKQLPSAVNIRSAAVNVLATTIRFTICYGNAQVLKTKRDKKFEKSNLFDFLIIVWSPPHEDGFRIVTIRTFANVLFRRLDVVGSRQSPCYIRRTRRRLPPQWRLRCSTRMTLHG